MSTLNRKLHIEFQPISYSSQEEQETKIKRHIAQKTSSVIGSEKKGTKQNILQMRVDFFASGLNQTNFPPDFPFYNKYYNVPKACLRYVSVKDVSGNFHKNKLLLSFLFLLKITCYNKVYQFSL